MAELRDIWEDGGFGLYIHWPYCQSKCPYCDFNSHVAAVIDQNRWKNAFLNEIERTATETPGRVLRSVFFGGGTPSLMDPELVDAVLRKVRQSWPIANDIEITLEANPTSVEAGRFSGYRAAGVNRVSMGIQALSDTDLRALGRLHTATEAQAAFHTARQIFDRVSFDLIYARQNQTAADWAQELRKALDLSIDHLSLYQLTVEDGTAFGDRFAAGRLKGLPDENGAADMYELTQSIAAERGFAAYEVSNHARPGQECQHNLIYWRSGDYVGIGPGAHGRITMGGDRMATEATKSPLAWLAQVEKSGNGESLRERLGHADHLAEALLMGLRLTEGVDLQRFSSLIGPNLYSNISALTDMGMVELLDGQLRATGLGRPVLNAVLRQLLPK